jgi:large subunit ribosomal protein L4
MIEIPIHNLDGQQVGTLQVDEQLLGGQVRPMLLKEAFVRVHANHRQGTAATKNRARVEGSTRKLYKQKHTGNARRGAIRTNIMRGGGRGHGKVPHSWRKGMPDKMRRLANRNALLAKALDGEVKIVDRFGFEKPSTSRFAKVLEALKIDRSCLAAFSDTRSHEARSAANIDHVCVSRIDHLNAFELLNHRYLLTEKAALEQYLARATGPRHTEVNALPEEAN